MIFSQITKNNHWESSLTIILLTLLFFPAQSQALYSMTLKDVIQKEIGDINFFQPSKINQKIINASVFKKYRLDNQGQNVFAIAIDINKAANGTGKVSTQDVTTESAELVVIINGVEIRYSQYSTGLQRDRYRKGRVLNTIAVEMVLL